MRKAEGAEAAEEVVKALRAFLKGKNAQALASLEEAGDELLAVHRLGAPATLTTTLLNTNCIENPYSSIAALAVTKAMLFPRKVPLKPPRH